MKPQFSKQLNHALTLVELVVIIFILALLLAILLPALIPNHNGVMKIKCVNNLKEIGLAYRIWGGDNGGKYPMQTSVTNGGTMELINGRNAWINFFVMSNELGSAKILHCPEDMNGFAATNFSVGFNNQNVSYFVNVDASDAFPQMILTGDDNFEIGGVPVKSGLLEISSNTPIAWTAARHTFAGNLGLADGSVQQVTQSGLHSALAATNRLAIP